MADFGKSDFEQNSTAFDIWKYFDHGKEELIEEERKKHLILIISYSLIIIVSFVGNVFVTQVIFEKRRSLSATNLLIANLAISNLIMTVINIPFNIAQFVLGHWPFGQTLCSLLPFIQSMSVHSSSITMMFIAIEKYKSLLYNTHLKCECFNRCSPFTGILALIGLLSALFSIPHGIYNRVKPLIWSDLVYCHAVYPEPRDLFRQRFTVISLLTQYLIPIIVTFICYMRIGLFLRHRKIIGNPSGVHAIQIERKNRRIKMLIIVVIVFAVCWLPFNVYLLATAYGHEEYSDKPFFIRHWFAMSSVCYSPFIYCWLDENFRHRFKTLVCSLVTNQTSDENTDNSIDYLSRETNRTCFIETELADERSCKQNCRIDINQQNEETYI